MGWPAFHTPPATLPDLLEAIYASRVTGQVLLVLHCQNGVPQLIDVGRPQPITAGCQRINLRAGASNALDTRKDPVPT